MDAGRIASQTAPHSRGGSRTGSGMGVAKPSTRMEPSSTGSMSAMCGTGSGCLSTPTGAATRGGMRTGSATVGARFTAGTGRLRPPAEAGAHTATCTAIYSALHPTPPQSRQFCHLQPRDPRLRVVAPAARPRRAVHGNRDAPVTFRSPFRRIRHPLIHLALLIYSSFTAHCPVTRPRSSQPCRSHLRAAACLASAGCRSCLEAEAALFCDELLCRSASGWGVKTPLVEAASGRAQGPRQGRASCGAHSVCVCARACVCVCHLRGAICGKCLAPRRKTSKWLFSHEPWMMAALVASTRTASPCTRLVSRSSA